MYGYYCAGLGRHNSTAGITVERNGCGHLLLESLRKEAAVVI